MLHEATQNYVKKNFSTIKQALKNQVRTYSNVIYDTGHLVYYKRKDNLVGKSLPL